MQTQTNNIKDIARAMSQYSNYNLSNFETEVIQKALPLAKRFLTQDIKTMEEYVADAQVCSLSPITYGRLNGTGFFWFHGDIKSPHWLKRIKADLYGMQERRKKLDRIKLFDKWSLACSYYTKTFATRDELIQDIISSGMDPNYSITLDGKSTGEKAIELIQF